jgi:glycosyltransferase involved in cell wall biosynthesis
MKIAQIIDSLSPGGAERLQVTFADAAQANKLDYVLAPLSSRPDSIVDQELRKRHVPIAEFPGRNLFDPFRIVRLTRYLTSQKIDLIHAHLEYAIIISALAGRLTGIPVVASLHNIHPDRWHRLEAFMLNHGVRSVIAVGQTVADVYKPKLKIPMKVVINPVKPVEPISASECNLIRSELIPALEGILLVAVGRLDRQKGFTDLIQAMHIVHEHAPRAVLIIAGQGVLHEQLQAQIETLGLQQVVKLLGIRSDIPRILAAADIFVSSSHWEGMPVSILEAMSAGLPVIATEVGDLPLMLAQGRGMLVPPQQPQALAEALLWMIDHAQEADEIGKRAKSHVLDHHSVSAWYQQLMEIYLNVS